MIGNGICNDETNNPECYYDGGDCCGSCINTNFCNNCTCISGEISNVVMNPFIGDGVCNDETNTADCDYDGMDCCKPHVNTTFCSECSCQGKLFIFHYRYHLPFS